MSIGRDNLGQIHFKRVPCMKNTFINDGLVIIELENKSDERLIARFLDSLKTNFLFDHDMKDSFDYKYIETTLGNEKFFGVCY
jgi:hypothetical protein